MTRKQYALLIALVIVLWMAGSACHAQTANVTLAWNPSTNPIVAGFNIYYGGASRVYTNKTSVGEATSLTISNLTIGATYYFAATTYSAAGAESALSSEVNYTVSLPAPPAPTNAAVNPTNFAVSWTAPPSQFQSSGQVNWTGYDNSNQFTLWPVQTNGTILASMPTNLVALVTNGTWTVYCYNVNNTGPSAACVFHWPTGILTNNLMKIWLKGNTNILYQQYHPALAQGGYGVGSNGDLIFTANFTGWAKAKTNRAAYWSDMGVFATTNRNPKPVLIITNIPIIEP